MANDIVEKVFSLYEQHAQSDYIGEAVTQIQHAVQCAQQAEMEGYGAEIILGAFLHDIGHLLGMERGTERMVTDGQVLGCHGHEDLGADFLTSLGFTPEVTSIARHHVNAKRYLVYKDANYHDGLSEASKDTLIHQGGPMTPDEAERFEQLYNFDVLIRSRWWDERAKDVSVESKDMSRYKEMCRQYFINVKRCDTDGE